MILAYDTDTWRKVDVKRMNLNALHFSEFR